MCRADLCDASAVQALFAGVQPDAVIHCAAWTDVDGAELPENREQVFAVNRDSTQNVAEASRDHGCKLLYVTTDYVFDGTDPAPYPADCDRFAPLNVYGQSKLAGERAVCGTLAQHFIVRTSWLYGAGGKNFVRTMLQLSRTHDTLRVVCDQVGTPTYVPDLARLLADMVETDRYGRYNAVNSGGYLSWYDFACAIFRAAGIPMTVLPVTSEEYGQSRAVRPAQQPPRHDQAGQPPVSGRCLTGGMRWCAISPQNNHKRPGRPCTNARGRPGFLLFSA